MTAGSYTLAFVAGLLSVLSPCVLPLVPIVLGTAASAHRLGPAALALGVAISFTVLGLFVATIGFAIGLDSDWFRKAAAGLLIVLGALLLLPSLQMRLAAAGGPVSNWIEARFGGLSGAGWHGQFGVGLLLGAVWAPCVGPTLGAASVLAAQGTALGQVALVMALFGIGAALPLLVLGLLSRQTLVRWRGGLVGAGQYAKSLLGGLLLAVGFLVLSGLDKHLEAFIVAISPDWLTRLTTAY